MRRSATATIVTGSSDTRMHAPNSAIPGVGNTAVSL